MRLGKANGDSGDRSPIRVSCHLLYFLFWASEGVKEKACNIEHELSKIPTCENGLFIWNCSFPVIASASQIMIYKVHCDLGEGQ